MCIPRNVLIGLPVGKYVVKRLCIDGEIMRPTISKDDDTDIRIYLSDNSYIIVNSDYSTGLRILVDERQPILIMKYHYKENKLATEFVQQGINIYHIYFALRTDLDEKFTVFLPN